jgi:uncharacterized protein YjbJ (UPF0337 family)
VSTVDKAKNKVQEAKGHVKEAAGKATDDKSLENEGKGDKVAGNLKQAGEKPGGSELGEGPTDVAHARSTSLGLACERCVGR